jgi:hypothetical protein
MEMEEYEIEEELIDSGNVDIEEWDGDPLLFVDFPETKEEYEELQEKAERLCRDLFPHYYELENGTKPDPLDLTIAVECVDKAGSVRRDAKRLQHCPARHKLIIVRSRSEEGSIGGIPTVSLERIREIIPRKYLE